MVLGGGPDHRRPADVDLLDQLIDRDPGTLECGRERVQVHHHELERRDAGAQQLMAVIGEAPIGQQPTVDARVQGLDPAVEHLRAAGHGRHVGHRQSGVAQRLRGPARRDELEAAGDEPAAQVGEARLVRHGQQRAARHRNARVGALEIDIHVAPVVGDADRAGQQQRNRPRQESVLHRADALVQGLGVITGEHRHGLLRHDRTAVERRVDKVDGDARDRHAVRQGVADGMRTRERREQRRVGVDDPPLVGREDRRPDQPHVAGEHDDVGPDACEGLGEGRVVAIADQRGPDPLLHGPVEGRTRPVRKDQHDVATELATGRRRLQRPQVGPGTRHADRDPAAGSRRAHRIVSSAPST